MFVCCVWCVCGDYESVCVHACADECACVEVGVCGVCVCVCVCVCGGV